MKRTLAIVACAAALAGLAGCANQPTPNQAGAATTAAAMQLPAVSRLAVTQKVDADLVLSPVLESDAVKLADPMVNCGKQGFCSPGAPASIELARLTDMSGKLPVGPVASELVEILTWTGAICNQHGPAGGATDAPASTCIRHTIVDATTGEIQGLWTTNGDK